MPSPQLSPTTENRPSFYRVLDPEILADRYPP
jgi:hypothetical protein